ncbi:hypothetical protein P8452_76261 [Trifolium repens]|nr:hypothetical protein P8452_76261 [Trifolium repens]
MEHYEKPIVSCYWLDSTISLSQHKKNNNIVVADHTTEKNKNVSTIDHRYSKNFVGKENLKVSSKDTTDHVGRKNMIKNVNEEELMKKEKKKPMEQYKRMQCEINKWKTLKIEWGFEDRRRLNKNIHRMLKVKSKRKR